MTTTALSTLLRDIEANNHPLRDLQARARRLRHADLLPPPPTPPNTASTPTPTPAPTPHDPHPAIDAKAETNQIPATLLREVYCREMRSSAPLPPGTDRIRAAHARVNTFIRLVQGDITAREDDADLLSRLNY